MKKQILSSTKVFTSSLPIDLCNSIDQYALENNIPKNKVIEKALLLFFEGIERQEFRESLKKYGRDAEFVELAEWGMDDYSKGLEKYPYEKR